MPLSPARLAQYLDGSGIAAEFVEETASTNSDLLVRARAQAPRQVLLRAAARQTQGRGRHGRRWHGAARGSLLFSVALPWDPDAGASASVTLACGLAAARQLQTALQTALQARGVAVRVKWPNDILLDGAKVAGILAELAEDASGARTLVVGMGMNLANDAQQLADIAAAADGAPGSGTPAVDLARYLGRDVVLADAEAWLARLAIALVGAAQDYARHGFAPLCDAFNAVCAYRGDAVQLHGGGAADIAGIVRGVDAQGRLLLEDGGALRALSSGELGLRQRAMLPAGGSPP